MFARLAVSLVLLVLPRPATAEAPRLSGGFIQLQGWMMKLTPTSGTGRTRRDARRRSRYDHHPVSRVWRAKLHSIKTRKRTTRRVRFSSLPMPTRWRCSGTKVDDHLWNRMQILWTGRWLIASV